MIVLVALISNAIVIVARSEQIGARVALIDRRPERVQIANLAANDGLVAATNATAEANRMKRGGGIC